MKERRYTDDFETHTKSEWIERTMEEYNDIGPEEAKDMVEEAIWLGDLHAC